MDYKLNEKMIIQDYELVKLRISILSGYIFDINKTIEFIKDEANTMIYFDHQMNITDKGDRSSTRVCIDTGYSLKESNVSILLILERIEGFFKGNEIESEQELINNILNPPVNWHPYLRRPILHPNHKVDIFRFKRCKQKEKIQHILDYSLDEVADINRLKDELSTLEYEKYIQTCIENCKKPHECINRISVHNFKSLSNIDDFCLKPITILCGINSCGKSSFLDSILVLKQTINNINSKNSIALNGEYVRLGNYTNVVFKHDNDRSISFKFSYESEYGDAIESLVDFIYGNEDVIEKDKRGTLEVEVTFANSNSADSRLVAQSDVTLFKADFKHSCGNSYIELSSVDKELFMLSFNIFRPIKKENNSKKKIKDKWNKTLIEVRNIAFKGFLIEPSSLYEQLQRNSKHSNSTNTITENSVVYQFIMAINSSIINMFNAIHYIGPLREAPSRRYVYDEVISEIGVKGENAAYLLQTGKDTLKEGLFAFDNILGRFLPLETCSLYEAVDYWMKYMGINSFNTSTNQEIIRVSLSDSNTNSISVNIADVGFGISQVFPIVLEGIRMEKGATLILEQPEIHLHPKLQMQIADFLLAMAVSGRNFIIETHSDHMINRIIRRMVEDEQQLLSNLVQVYFVTPSEDGAHFESIEINDTKGIVNWPEGFFDQAANEQELIIRAGLKKRKKQKQSIKESKHECCN